MLRRILVALRYLKREASNASLEGVVVEIDQVERAIAGMLGPGRETNPKVNKHIS